MPIVPIDSITLRGGPDLRPVNEQRIKALASSIAEIGLQNPISVCAIEVPEDTAYSHNGKRYRLIAGEHRLRACVLLDLEEVPVNILSLTDLQCELWQIDENLMRSELTELERAEHLRHRKELYLVIHPETKHGGAAPKKDGLGGKEANFASLPAFVQDASEKTGMSKRSIAASVHRAEHISPEVREAIRDTRIADTGVELDALARMPEPEQAKAVEMVKSGEAKTVREAAALLETPVCSQVADPVPNEDDPLTPDEVRYTCEDIHEKLTRLARCFSYSQCGKEITANDLAGHILKNDPEILIRKEHNDDDVYGIILEELKSAYDLFGAVIKVLLKSTPDIQACRTRLVARQKKQEAREKAIRRKKKSGGLLPRV